MAHQRDRARSGPPHTIVYARKSSSNTSGVLVLRRHGAVLMRRFAIVRFIRCCLGGGCGCTPGVGNNPLSRFFPAYLTRLLAAVFIFCPDMTSSAMCTPVFNARFPNATAPRLMNGVALWSRPPNTLPNPCPRCTRAPTK